MDINATLIGQMITFALFVWFTMKFIWPPLTNVMEERRKKIAAGLSASEEGQRELEQAKVRIAEQMEQVKADAARIIEAANQRGSHIIEEAKQQARIESERIVHLAQNEIQQSYNQVKTELMQQVAQIAVAGAEKILRHEVDKKVNDRLVEELINEM